MPLNVTTSRALTAVPAMTSTFRPYEPTRLYGGHYATITAITISPHATYLATAALDGKICIWETATHKLLYEYTSSSSALSIAWVPTREDGVVCGLMNGYVVSLSFSKVLSLLVL